MSLLRPVAMSFLLAGCALPLAAQSAARTPNIAQAAQDSRSAPRDNVLHVPPLASAPPLSSTTAANNSQNGLTPEQEKALAGVQLKLQKGQLQAQSEGTCFTLRSYGFTDQDLQSADPRPSSSTTCTAATSGKMKQTISVGVKVKR